MGELRTLCLDMGHSVRRFERGYDQRQDGFIAGLRSGLIFGLMMSNRLIGGLIVGLIFGLIGGLGGYGGETVVQHYILRRLISWQRILPFPFKDQTLIAYLDAMAARILLRRVGGGWVFIHRTLLDYFASLHSSAAPAEPEHAGVNHPDATESG